MASQNQGHEGRRATQSLDGAWDFCHGHDGIWREAIVPQPWQAAYAGLRHKSGRAVYKKAFELPKDWAGRDVALKFGAVNYFAEVRVNSVLVGTHEGGYLPFECALADKILIERNSIEVSVVMPDGDAATSPDFPFAEIPHGKQSWYGAFAGIWQSVTLEARNPCHLDHCRITPDLASGIAAFDLTLPAASIGATLIISVTGPDGAPTALAKHTVGQMHETIAVQFPPVKPWSPDAPNLYLARIDLVRNGAPCDSTTHTFGFRKIETRGGRFYLNGEPLYLRGALDQDYYPQGICTPPSLAFLEDQLQKAKQLGLNLLRCHIKVPDPRYYEVADRLGMLIWTEIPNVATFTVNSARRMRETMEGILARDFNHPSIIIWTLINEDWGTRLVEDASHRHWLKETYGWLKTLDPTRLVVDNSACHNNFHVTSDINDYHYYRSVPERRAEWDKLTEEFASGADWTYSPHGDGERRGDEPLVVSEFGVWGLPDPAKVANTDGSEPWWMETGAGWGDGAATPHGVQNRFAAYQLESAFGSFDAFIAQVQWYQFANLKYEIETMRARASIQGYVITELTDVHWESNGLLDMNRNPRVFHEQFASINSDLMIVPKVARYSGTSGQAFRFNIAIATGGVTLPAGTVLEWSLDGGAPESLLVPAVQALCVTELGEMSIALPPAAANRIVRLNLRLLRGGKELTRNHFDIALFVPRDIARLPTVSCLDEVLAGFARGLGYRVVPPEMANVRLAHGLDSTDISAMQNGAFYAVLAGGSANTHGNLRLDAPIREQPFMPIIDGIPGNLPGPDNQLPNIALTARHGTLWRGDWIASFSWIRRDDAFASLPGGPMLDLSYDRVVPHHVMTGFRPWEYGGSVHAGLVVGWVHKPAALIAERRVGKGGLIASTFRLLQDAPGEDAVAATLFDALVSTAMNASRTIDR